MNNIYNTTYEIPVKTDVREPAVCVPTVNSRLMSIIYQYEGSDKVWFANLPGISRIRDEGRNKVWFASLPRNISGIAIVAKQSIIPLEKGWANILYYNSNNDTSECMFRARAREYGEEV